MLITDKMSDQTRRFGSYFLLQMNSGDQRGEGTGKKKSKFSHKINQFYVKHMY